MRGRPLTYAAVEVECMNGHRWIQHIDFQTDVTGAGIVAEEDEVCPTCGEEGQTDDQLQDVAERREQSRDRW